MSIDLNKAPSFWSRLGRAFVNILRFLLILVVITAIAAVIYFSVPYLYEKFIIPVETNTARLSEVENKAAADVEQLASQISALQIRLSDLETRQTESAQALAEMQGQVEVIKSAVDAQSDTLKKMESLQASLDALSAVSAEQGALQAGYDSALADLQRQVSLSRSIEILSRARLYLSQSNFGLARADVRTARDLLSSLQLGMPSEKLTSLQGVIFWLDLALENLPTFPVVAVDEVDIAWQLLVNDLPDGTDETLLHEQPIETPTPEQPFETPTPEQPMTTFDPEQTGGTLAPAINFTVTSTP